MSTTSRCLAAGVVSALVLGPGAAPANPTLTVTNTGAYGSITVDGTTSTSGPESYYFIPESSSNPAQVNSGGALNNSTTQSDFIGESAAGNWYDITTTGNLDIDSTLGGGRHQLGSQRADIQYVHLNFDATHLYLNVKGPNVYFNNWTGLNGNNGDQGDLFLALDFDNQGTAAGAGTFLTANGGHSTFNLNPQDGISGSAGGPLTGQKAVDFLGWRPDYVVGVQYFDNGGGGGGYANVQRTGTNTVVAGGGQNVNHAGFQWTANLAGDGLELRIPWAVLGVTLPTNGTQSLTLNFAAYTTYNLAGFDTYDSGPGFGNTGPYEEIGDAPGDWDGTLLNGTPVDDDKDAGSFTADSGSNLEPPTGYSPYYARTYTNDFNATPNHLDGIDTIEQYYTFRIVGPTAVPEPVSVLTLIGALLCAHPRRRPSRPTRGAAPGCPPRWRDTRHAP